MASNHRKNTASTAESRPIRNSGLQSGQFSSESKELEYAQSNSNHKLNPSIDHPPPYAMENNAKMENGIPLHNVRPQHTEGEPAEDHHQPTTIAIEPEESLCSRFCEYIKPTPFFTMNLSPYFNFELNIHHLIIAVIIFGLWSWASWGFSKTT